MKQVEKQASYYNNYPFNPQIPSTTSRAPPIHQVNLLLVLSVECRNNHAAAFPTATLLEFLFKILYFNIFLILFGSPMEHNQVSRDSSELPSPHRLSSSNKIYLWCWILYGNWGVKHASRITGT